MTDLFKEIKTYLKKLKVAYVDSLAPPYIASAMTHWLNLTNKSSPFLFQHGRPMDLRLHIFMVAPPGMGKSLFIELFTSKYKHAVLSDTLIRTAYLASLSEAGLIGTIRFNGGEPIKQYGLAYQERDSIIGCEEFHALTVAMQQKHSANLDNALLLALDSGKVKKDLAAGNISYETRFTLWSAGQPERFELASGLARRFLFIYFVPTLKQMEELKKYRREARGSRISATEILELKNKINDRLSELRHIEGIQFDPEFDNLLDSLDIPHYEEPLIEKYSIGYSAAVGKIEDRVLYVEVTEDLRDQIAYLNEWRYNIKSGADTNQILALLKGIKRIEYEKLLQKLSDLGLEYSRSAVLLNILNKSKKIRFKTISDITYVEVL